MGVAEAARRLGYRLDYVYSLIWAGKLGGRKVDGRWLIPVAAVKARLRRARSAAETVPELAAAAHGS